MKKIVIIPDSFKGTMSSRKVGEIISEEAKRCWPEAEVIRAEVADGGEGSVDAFLSVLHGYKKCVQVTGPYGENIDSFYGLIDDIAVIEMAAAAGLPLVGERLNAGATTTMGVGQLIIDALNHGVRKIILGLGGSATNDGGAGMAAACGVRFLDKEKKSFIPVGNTLCEIAEIDFEGMDSRLKDVEIVAMCDIDNPICGENGAAAVFAPQKGASKEDVLRLDKGLFHLSKILRQTIGTDVMDLKGGGAAGGMGAGVAAFLGASLQSGIDVILDAIHFEEMLKDCSMVITGEGKIDGQSVQGKVISGIAKRAAVHKIPVIAIVGAIADDVEPVYDIGVSAIFSINQVPLPFEEIKERTCSDLRKTAKTIFQFAELAKNMK